MPGVFDSRDKMRGYNQEMSPNNIAWGALKMQGSGNTIETS
ncbi:MAG: hypothetical protein WCP36_07205 [Methanomicrobiales archaeon]